MKCRNRPGSTSVAFSRSKTLQIVALSLAKRDVFSFLKTFVGPLTSPLPLMSGLQVTTRKPNLSSDSVFVAISILELTLHLSDVWCWSSTVPAFAFKHELARNSVNLSSDLLSVRKILSTDDTRVCFGLRIAGFSVTEVPSFWYSNLSLGSDEICS